MDTDDLTKEAYRVLIVESAKVSEFLQAEMGASARLFADEDAYLKAMYEVACDTAEEAEDYLDFWGMLRFVDPVAFARKAEELAGEIKRVLDMPIAERGPVEW